MKKCLILFMMLLVFNYSYSAIKIMPENDLKQKGLKGKVMRMVKHTRKYDQEGKDKDIREEIITYFNLQGYITMEIHKGNGVTAYVLIYKYDENGYLIESNDIYGIKYEYEYEYDENGNLIQTKREKKPTSFGQLEKNIYNKEGKLIKSLYYTQSEFSKKGVKVSGLSKYIVDKKNGMFELMDEWEYEYEKNIGKSSKIKTLYGGESEIFREERGNGEYLETVVDNGVQEFKTLYDKNGNELEYCWVTYFPKPCIQTYIVYKDGVKRDKYGNLTERIGKYVEVIDDEKGIANELGEVKEIKIEYKYYDE